MAISGSTGNVATSWIVTVLRVFLEYFIIIIIIKKKGGALASETGGFARWLAGGYAVRFAKHDMRGRCANRCSCFKLNKNGGRLGLCFFGFFGLFFSCGRAVPGLCGLWVELKGVWLPRFVRVSFEERSVLGEGFGLVVQLLLVGGLLCMFVRCWGLLRWVVINYMV